MVDTIFTDISDAGSPPVYKFYDGSNWKQSVSGEVVDVTSCVTGELLGQVQQVTIQEIDDIFIHAKKAQITWEQTPLYKRVKTMQLAADWIRHHATHLATFLTKEIGKTALESQNEIIRTADLIDQLVHEVVSLRGETLEGDMFSGFQKGKTAIVDRVAHGVVCCIAPFNYPLNLAVSKIVPALLMGNAVVFKPSTQGAITGLHLVKIFLTAGLPPNVLSVVTGAGAVIGDYLVTHKDTSMVAFTGSSEVGEHIAKIASIIPLLLECGGNNPALVLPDANIHGCAREIVKGAFSYSGQRCTAIKYILATPKTFEKLIPSIMSSMEEMICMGDPRNPETKLVGPVISKESAERIQNAIDDAKTQGAIILKGGKREGLYVEPTLLSHVTPSMDIVKQEIFGPICSCIEIQDISEGIRIINDSQFGLQASVFSSDEGAAMVIGRQLHVGTVQINGSPQRGPDHFPFLGVKKSGLGVQGVKYSLLSFSRVRSLVLNSPM